MDGYLRATGIPVNLPVPNLKGGALSGLQPIQFGGSPPVQIRALGGWDVPTSQPYIANALASLGGSIASVFDERTKRKQAEADKKAEREFKANEARLDREAKAEILNAKERIKSHSVTDSAKAEADDFFSQSVGDAGVGATEGIEPELPKPAGDDGGAGFRALTQTPDPSADQSARGASKSPLQGAEKPQVVGFLEESLLRAADQQPKVPKAIPVTKQGEPDAVAQQTPGLLEGSEAPKPQPHEADKGAPYGRGAMGEPNLRPQGRSGALKYPTTFRSMNQYMKVKDFMDSNPEYGFTLSGKPKYDPKRGVLVDTEYIDKSIESTKKQEREEKQKERESKSLREAKEHAEKITLQEDRSVMSHPSFKNFEGQSGYRPMTKIFISAYDVVKRNPKAAGISDMELIDTYVRAATGGKPTEAQFHAAERGKSWGEILGLTLRDKPLSGAKLSQGQRDQMLRTMLENYNASAEIANDMFDTVRKKMIQAGQTDDLHHPKDYVSNLILKSDAENKLIENKERFLSLQQSKKEAIRNNDQEEISLIDEQMAELAKESEDLSKRLKKEKYSGSEILGIKDFKHKKQGHVGGAGGFIDFGSLQMPTPQVNISPDNR